jgi:intracellular sulfur oxidation DsrE/DsrF family protein
MSGYLLIASSDPFESVEVQNFFRLARRLVEADNGVTLLLVQNGVLPARRSAPEPWIGDLVQAGVEVVADEFSLRERGIPRERLRSGVEAVPLDVAIDRLVEGWKSLWI